MDINNQMCPMQGTYQPGACPQSPVYPQSPAYPQSSAYSQSPAYPQPPVYLQVIHYPYLDAETGRRLQAEIDRLRFQLEQKTLQEHALKQAYRLQGKAYWTMLRSGQMVKFTDFSFEEVRYFSFDPHFFQEPLVAIKISRHPTVLLEMKDFLNDRALFNLLQMKAGGRITPFGSVSQVAVLLRSIACEMMQSTFIPFFSGWCSEDDRWDFSVFDDFRTCAKAADPLPSCHLLPEILPAAAKIAAEHLHQDFAVIRDPVLRMTLLLWVHAAFLHTPLEAFGVRVRHALHVNVSGVAAQDCLEKLLLFGNDQVISLDNASDSFTRELYCRKDRTLVIREGQAGRTAMENAAALREALHTGTVKLTRRGHESLPAPVHTLPVILGREHSLLDWQPEVIPIQMSAEDLDREACADLSNKADFRTEYWTAFASFLKKDMPSLRESLKRNLSAARSIADDHELTAELAELLGALLAVKELLDKFSTDLGLPASDTDGIWISGFLQALEDCAAQSDTLDGLADIFVEIGRQMIRSGRLACCPHGQCETETDPRGTVYFNSDTLSLDRIAFSQICLAARCSPGAVKRDLKEKGYLVGKPVNAQSYMTRITCCNVYGQTKTLLVYQFERSRFEKLGEPSLL